jgi:hypothetical protein
MFRTVNSRKVDLWRSRLRRFQESGLSVTRFCQVEQVSAPAFYHWRKRLGASPGAEAPPTFVPVRLTPAAVGKNRGQVLTFNYLPVDLRHHGSALADRYRGRSVSCD